jgi:type II secretory pathway pseudopilin PulG
MRSAEAGYTLVAIVIGMAILAILTAAVAPAVSMIMQEDREEELIFRGRQLVRGMVLFQKRYGRFPTSLKEMYDAKPRTIRQLWKDPMCNCDNWYLIVLGTPGVQIVPPGTTPSVTPTPKPTAGPFDQGITKNTGPIIGVHSNVAKKSLRTWRGQSSYDLWEFRVGDADRPDLNLPIQAPPGSPPSLIGR